MTPLHQLGEALRRTFAQVDLVFVRALFVAIPLALLLWVATLPRREARPPDGRNRLAEDLRLWAALALVIQILVYVFL